MISCETGSFSHLLQWGNPHQSLQSALCLSFLFSQPCQPLLLPCCELFLSACLTSLVSLVDCFFNSLVVRVPCRLILWHFWCLLILDWLLSSFWLCEEVKGFYLWPHLGRNLRESDFFFLFETWSIVQYGQWKQKERKVPSVVPCWHLLFILGITPQCLSTRKVVDSSGMSMSVDGNGV